MVMVVVMMMVPVASDHDDGPTARDGGGDDDDDMMVLGELNVGVVRRGRPAFRRRPFRTAAALRDRLQQVQE